MMAPAIVAAAWAAVLAADVRVGPYSIIGPGVRIGAATVVEGRTEPVVMRGPPDGPRPA